MDVADRIVIRVVFGADDEAHALQGVHPEEVFVLVPPICNQDAVRAWRETRFRD